MTDALRSNREPKQPGPDRSTKDVEKPSRRRYPIALYTSPFPRHPVLPSGHGRKQESNLLMPAVSSYCFVSDFTESFGAKEECERRIRITGCPAVPRQNSPLFDTLTVKRPLGRTPSVSLSHSPERQPDPGDEGRSVLSFPGPAKTLGEVA
ncbi:hypothetical protein ROHU_005864 [Labeo rohita]|uniref:Uncharacterized protein n=1 Tax=Labeo rohita TaxID=84645 RepID=A0A498NA45_LABRO|nr:hypothetical protein ROHU_005864 [Labeo rohita]